VADRVTGEVISLASRRRPAAVARAPEPVRPTTRRPLLALAAGGLLLALALAAGAHFRSVADIPGLSAGERARIFRRALDDLKTGCGDRAHEDGALRDHCRAQAEFLTLFPECDGACRALAAASLPHARR
jgi:hypothetical protein